MGIYDKNEGALTHKSDSNKENKGILSVMHNYTLLQLHLTDFDDRKVVSIPIDDHFSFTWTNRRELHCYANHHY